MKTVLVKNDYPVSADRLWAIATDYGALAEIMKGIAVFEGLPQGRARTGQKLNVMVSLFGKLPSQPYYMEVVECNDDAMVLRSLEQGAGVKTWHHTLTVEATPSGSRLTDRIEIDAGFFTYLFALWARYLYSARHRPRLKMLSK